MSKMPPSLCPTSEEFLAIVAKLESFEDRLRVISFALSHNLDFKVDPQPTALVATPPFMQWAADNSRQVVEWMLSRDCNPTI